MKEKKIQVSVALSPSTLRFIDVEAKRQNRSRSNLIEHILREYLVKRMLEGCRYLLEAGGRRLLMERLPPTAVIKLDPSIKRVVRELLDERWAENRGDLRVPINFEPLSEEPQKPKFRASERHWTEYL